MLDVWDWDDESRIEAECVIVDALEVLRDFLDGYEDISVEVWDYGDRVALKCFEISYGRRLMFAAFGDCLDEAYVVLIANLTDYYKSIRDTQSS